MRVGSYSMMGTKHKVNQDSFFVKNAGKKILCFVADGMGGHNAGDVASRAAVEIIGSVKNYDKKTVLNAINEANSNIKSMSECDSSLEGMGTTLVLAVLNGENGYIVNVGDSRAYGVNRTVVKQISTDHSYVQNLIDEGKITAEQAKNHPMKNVITKALGVSDSIEPAVRDLTVGKDDIILLCSDGVSGSVSDEEIKLCCFENIPETAAENLCRLAVKNGATDDVTAIIIRMN